MNYNDVVSSLREIARDGLRLKKVNSLRADRLVLSTDLSSTQRNLEDFTLANAKTVAILNFKLAQLVDADPEKEDKTKRYNNDLEFQAKHLTEVTEGGAERVEELNKAISELDERIAKVQSGEWKVDMDALNAAAECLIKEVTHAVASKISLDTAEKAS